MLLRGNKYIYKNCNICVIALRWCLINYVVRRLLINEGKSFPFYICLNDSFYFAFNKVNIGSVLIKMQRGETQ